MLVGMMDLHQTELGRFHKLSKASCHAAPQGRVGGHQQQQRPADMVDTLDELDLIAVVKYHELVVIDPSKPNFAQDY